MGVFSKPTCPCVRDETTCARCIQLYAVDKIAMESIAATVQEWQAGNISTALALRTIAFKTIPKA